MPTDRNRPPADVWEALRRLRACNRAQLAAALGVSPRTLRRWQASTDAGDALPAAAEAKAARLLICTLRLAGHADQLARLTAEQIDAKDTPEQAPDP